MADITALGAAASVAIAAAHGDLQRVARRKKLDPRGLLGAAWLAALDSLAHGKTPESRRLAEAAARAVCGGALVSRPHRGPKPRMISIDGSEPVDLTDPLSWALAAEAATEAARRAGNNVVGSAVRRCGCMPEVRRTDRTLRRWRAKARAASHAGQGDFWLGGDAS